MSEDSKKHLNVNITSTMAEKAIDLAKDFLDKLIMPSAEEAGLLLKGTVTYWRLKNQVATLNKAKKLCEEQGIKPKTINLKLLVPLLDGAALEEDDYMQDKWAQLLANLVDSKQNIENHVFPYILSQVSIEEIKHIQTFFENFDFSDFLTNREWEINNVESRIQHLDYTFAQHLELQKKEIKAKTRSYEKEDMLATHRELKDQYEKRKAKILLQEFSNAEIDVHSLQGYQTQNLIRLGVFKEVTTAIGAPSRSLDPTNLTAKQPVVNILNKTFIELTELGFLFIKAISKKRS